VAAAVSRRLAALLLILSLGACAGQARGPGVAASFSDGRFRIEWQTAQTAKGAPLIAGYVENTRGGGANNLRMKVETLDAQGQVIGTTTALVPGYVGGFSRTYFEVPLHETGVGYRVSVASFDQTGHGE
jgi:hypothetical protein